MRTKRSLITTITAFTAAGIMALSGCGGSDTAGTEDKNQNFIVGALLPQTGSLAFLSPPEDAAIKLAVKDINDAGGVLDKDATTVVADTSDAEHADQNASATQSVLSKHPSVVIGPAASGVVKNVYKSITSQEIPVISMAATSMQLSGVDPYFFRTVAPDSVQGSVVGDLIAQDGVKKLAILTFNDEYGTGLRDVVLQKTKDSGVDVVYGESDTFDPTETNFASIATAVKAANPDAVLIITYDQATPLIKALASAGVDTHKLYMVDGNTSNYEDTFEAGLLEGSKGTIPGAEAKDDFVKRLEEVYGDLKGVYTYAAETYDAVIFAALAAQKGGSADGKTVKENLPAVSGSTKGEECNSYKDCVALLKDKKEIRYVGQTGIGAFNEKNDPSSASVGVYVYDKENVNKFSTQQTGDVPSGE